MLIHVIHVIYSDHTPLFRVICEATYARRETEKKHPKGLEEIGKLSVRQLCFQALVRRKRKESLVHTGGAGTEFPW